MECFDFKHEKYHMGHFVLDLLSRRPNEICQIDAATEESETNESVLRRSIQLALCFRQFGTKPGDVLALSGRDHLDLHIPYYAALLNGMPITGIDPLYKYLEVKPYFKVCLPRVAFCQKEQLDDYLRAVKELELDTKVICFDDGEYSMKKFIEQNDPKNDGEFAPLDFDLEKIYAWLVCTSGTLGVIKLAAFKHKRILEKIVQFKTFYAHVGAVHRLNSDVIKPALHLSPVQWISAFFNHVCFPLLRQVKVSTSDAITTEHVIDLINKYKPDGAMIAPFLVRAILKSDKKCDLTCLSRFMMSGVIIRREIILELKRRMSPDAKVVEVYGLTESLGPLLLPNPDGPVGNCGICPPGWEELKLVDKKTGQEVTQPNTPAELWIKGARLSEYYNNPEETANTITSDGWFKTGDVLYKDENGNYFFVERGKKFIECCGYEIIAAELEAVILKHPGVEDVSITSIDHEIDYQQPVACVVRKKGTNVTAKEIKDIVINNLSESQQLYGGVVFMDELPRTSNGKVAEGKLRQMVLTANRE